MRNNAIDIMKGLGIMAVMYSHGPIYNGYGANYINSFDLPLFFIISGYFLKTSEDFLPFVAKKAKRLLIPYFVTGLCIILYYAIGWGKDQESVGVLHEIAHWGVAVLWGSSSMGYQNGAIFSELPRIGAIWFLYALFVSNVAMYVCAKYVNCSIRPLLVVGLFIVAGISYQYVWLPCSMQSGLTALIFVYAGWLARQHKDELSSIMHRYKYAIHAFGLAMWVSSAHAHFISIAINDIPQPYWTIPGCLYAVFLIYKLSQQVDKSILRKPLAYIGNISLLILCVHLFDLDCFQPYFNELRADMHYFIPIWIGKALFYAVAIYLLTRLSVVNKVFGLKR